MTTNTKQTSKYNALIAKYCSHYNIYTSADFPCGVTQQQKGVERTALTQGNHVTGPYFIKILSPDDRRSSHPTPSVEVGPMNSPESNTVGDRR